MAALRFHPEARVELVEAILFHEDARVGHGAKEPFATGSSS